MSIEICAKCHKPMPGSNSPDICCCAFPCPIEAKPRDTVNHPRHYNSHPSGIECIAVVEHMNFNTGNAIKYLWRADHKNGLEDLRKAAWYIQREIERVTKCRENS